MGEPDKTFGVTPPRCCGRCQRTIDAGRLYTRAYVRNDWARDMTDQPEAFVSIHVDCPTS